MSQHHDAAVAADPWPCPFCGSIDVIYDAGAMVCGFCDTRGPPARHGHVALTAWNTRTVSDATHDQLRALVDSLLANYRMAAREAMGFERVAHGTADEATAERDTRTLDRTIDDYRTRLELHLRTIAGGGKPC